MIVCLRTVGVPTDERRRFIAWIEENRAVREQHGILFELVLESTNGDTVVTTGWPSHEVFDRWIGTPERERLTCSAVHRAVDYRPLTRYDFAGGYFNLPSLAKALAP